MINEEILMKNRDGCMLSLLKFNEENISVKELRNKTEVGMADEEKARQKARGYDTEYAEDFMMSDMLSRPQDFDKQSIKDVYLCLKEKHYRDGYLDGLAEGRKSKWHDLRKNPDDLPKCAEDEQVIFYVHEYYKGIEKYINHYCLGFYKKIFYE